MTDNVARVRQWLEVLGRGEFEEWDDIVADDLMMHIVAMPGDNHPVIGRDANRARALQVWKSWRYFAFHDVEAHAAADDPDVVFVIARAEAETVWGANYSNLYSLRLRLRDGLIHEHVEFFDPAVVMKVFKDHLGQ